MPASARPADWALRIRSDARIGLVVGAGMVVVYLPRMYAAAGGPSPDAFASMLGNVYMGWSLMGLIIVWLNRAASRLMRPLWARLAMVTGCSCLVRWLVPSSILQLGFNRHLLDISASAQALLLELAWTTAVCAVLTTLYLDRSSTRSSAEQRLAALRREHRWARRRLVEARLRVLRAHIDPQLFFEMLETVRDRYATNPAAAESLLEHLTVYLRAAMPRLRTAMSTVGQEIELVRARTDLLNAACSPMTTTLSLQVAAGVAGLPFPAGVLMPLLQALSPAESAGPRALEVVATHGLHAVRLRLQGPAGAAEPALDSVRETLAALYDDQAVIGSRPGLGGSWIIDVEVRHAG